MSKYTHTDAVDLVIHALERYGLNVHSKKEKDIDVLKDILVVFPKEKKTMSIVVRTITPAGHYTWISKDKFDVDNDELYIAAVYITSPKEPMIYLLPATAWKRQIYPFITREYDKPDLISEPEYGIDFNQKSMDKLSSYTLTNIMMKLGFTYL